VKLLAAVAAALVLSPAASAVTGQQRVLLMQVTWGPEPWPAAHGQESLDEARAYIRSASFGRTWVDGTATPWLRALPGPPPGGCDIRRVEAAANAAATAAGYALASYTKLGYAFPEIGCPWGGAYFSPGIWMNGIMSRHVVAHELGHTYGVTEEGPGWACRGGACEVENYASPYSVMGHGFSDYNAFEKLTFGWLDRVARPRGAAELALGAIDRPTPEPQALHVLTAAEEYWLEYRPPAPLWSADEPTATPGIVVHAGTNGLSFRSRFPQRNLLLLDPVGAGRPSVVAGETFSVPGAFAVAVRSTEAARATVAFRWTDAARPTAPRIESAGRALVRWRPAADSGSGVAAYDVSVDGRRVRRLTAVQIAGTVYLEGPRQARYPRLARGRHRIGVVAVDRAGNRSRSATRTVVVR
jgi:Gametolysin peptidase M11